MGLVAITNAEKVILDRVDQEEDSKLFTEEEYNKVKLANELRNIIGQLPNLAIYIDEVHHAADGEIKLRKVVNEWTRAHSFNAVLGFSGTPYLEKAENVVLGETFSIKNTDLANVVYYYPLIEGIGNFLKIPEVKYADNETDMIGPQRNKRVSGKIQGNRLPEQHPCQTRHLLRTDRDAGRTDLSARRRNISRLWTGPRDKYSEISWRKL